MDMDFGPDEGDYFLTVVDRNKLATTNIDRASPLAMADIDDVQEADELVMMQVGLNKHPDVARDMFRARVEDQLIDLIPRWAACMNLPGPKLPLPVVFERGLKRDCDPPSTRVVHWVAPDNRRSMVEGVVTTWVSTPVTSTDRWPFRILHNRGSIIDLAKSKNLQDVLRIDEPVLLTCTITDTGIDSFDESIVSMQGPETHTDETHADLRLVMRSQAARRGTLATEMEQLRARAWARANDLAEAARCEREAKGLEEKLFDMALLHEEEVNVMQEQMAKMQTLSKLTKRKREKEIDTIDTSVTIKQEPIDDIHEDVMYSEEEEKVIDVKTAGADDSSVDSKHKRQRLADRDWAPTRQENAMWTKISNNFEAIIEGQPTKKYKPKELHAKNQVLQIIIDKQQLLADVHRRYLGRVQRAAARMTKIKNANDLLEQISATVDKFAGKL